MVSTFLRAFVLALFLPRLVFIDSSLARIIPDRVSYRHLLLFASVL